MFIRREYWRAKMAGYGMSPVIGLLVGQDYGLCHGIAAAAVTIPGAIILFMFFGWLMGDWSFRLHRRSPSYARS